jgi:hypothetical protein
VEIVTLKELEWIHDCIVSVVAYNAGGNEKLINIAMSCPDDLGFAPWEGRQLELVAVDVAIANYSILGWSVEEETVDAIRPGISRAVQDSTAEARRRGICYPNLEFTVSFHSGSSLEVICRELRIDIV